jgi:hypothetical protein
MTMPSAEPKADNAPMGKRLNRPDYGLGDTRERAVKTISVFAKPGAKIHAVVRVFPDGHRRMRLYTVCNGELTRIDGLVNPTIFDELIAVQAYDADKIDYNGFDRTDGTDCSGFGWPADSYSNVALGIIYGLASLVHGDRRTWTANFI